MTTLRTRIADSQLPAVLLGHDRTTTRSFLAAAVAISATLLALSALYELFEFAIEDPIVVVFGAAIGAIAVILGRSPSLSLPVSSALYGTGGACLAMAAFGGLSSLSIAHGGTFVAGLVLVGAVGSLVHAYINRGLVVCWVLAAAPFFGFVAPLFAAGGSFGRDYSALDVLVQSSISAGSVGLLVGSAGFVLGFVLSRSGPRSERKNDGARPSGESAAEPDEEADDEPNDKSGEEPDDESVAEPAAEPDGEPDDDQ